MMAVAWVPLLGKYVPGKVAAITSAVLLLKRFGVAVAVALSVVLVLDGLAVLAGLMLGSRLLLTPDVQKLLPGGPLLCAMVVIGGLIAIYPPVYGRLVNFGLKVLKRSPLPHVPTLRDYALPAVTAFLQWVLSGTGLWLMTRAVAPELSVTHWPMFVSVAALAMTVSYLALFAPGGIGVREGIFLIGLAPIVGATTASIVVVAMRLLHTLIELLLTGVGWAMLRSVARGANAGAPAVTPAS
jgi:hypothetical protein